MSKSAFIVVDLGFGDAGKGLITDYLVRRHRADLVVRFNGGAQAGHNVVTPDGRHHTFSQFGSGTFVPGVRTHLGREVVVHPTALAVEAQALARVGEHRAIERLSVHPDCLVTTPFQQAHGRLLELARGDARHGSCGVGVGPTVADSIAHPELVVRFGELAHPTRALRERLQRERDHKLALWPHIAPEHDREFRALKDANVLDRWLGAASAVASQVALLDDEMALEQARCVVFEGAQGVLLDQDFGFHPYTTYSRCTPHAARALLEASRFEGPARCIGVLRSYAVRHGVGPLPTEADELVSGTTEHHNQHGPWQGAVRKGYFDVPLLRYALAASARVDALCITHLDELPNRVCERYANVESLPLPRNLAEQEQLTGLLFAQRPRYTRIESERAFLELVAGAAELPVAYTSRGPRASDVTECSTDPRREELR